MLSLVLTASVSILAIRSCGRSMSWLSGPVSPPHSSRSPSYQPAAMVMVAVLVSVVGWWADRFLGLLVAHLALLGRRYQPPCGHRAHGGTRRHARLSDRTHSAGSCLDADNVLSVIIEFLGGEAHPSSPHPWLRGVHMIAVRSLAKSYGESVRCSPTSTPTCRPAGHQAGWCQQGR